jgi:tetratricopeptide (TPR) repeat protein
MAASLALTIAVLSPMILTVSLPVLAQTQNDRKAEGDRLFQAGSQAYQAGKTTEALEIFQKALSIFRQTGDHVGESNTLNTIGAIYKAQG